jgi:hypothetical protein
MHQENRMTPDAIRRLFEALMRCDLSPQVETPGHDPALSDQRARLSSNHHKIRSEEVYSNRLARFFNRQEALRLRAVDLAIAEMARSRRKYR